MGEWGQPRVGPSPSGFRQLQAAHGHRTPYPVPRTPVMVSQSQVIVNGWPVKSAHWVRWCCAGGVLRVCGAADGAADGAALAVSSAACRRMTSCSLQLSAFSFQTHCVLGPGSWLHILISWTT